MSNIDEEFDRLFQNNDDYSQIATEEYTREMGDIRMKLENCENRLKNLRLHKQLQEDKVQYEMKITELKNQLKEARQKHQQDHFDIDEFERRSKFFYETIQQGIASGNYDFIDWAVGECKYLFKMSVLRLFKLHELNLDASGIIKDTFNRWVRSGCGCSFGIFLNFIFLAIYPWLLLTIL